MYCHNGDLTIARSIGIHASPHMSPYVHAELCIGTRCSYGTHFPRATVKTFTTLSRRVMSCMVTCMLHDVQLALPLCISREIASMSVNGSFLVSVVSLCALNA